MLETVDAFQPVIPQNEMFSFNQPAPRSAEGQRSATYSGSRRSSDSFQTDSSMKRLKVKIQEFGKEKMPPSSMPVIKKVEIWGPQKELILRAKVPTPNPSQKSPDIRLLSIDRPNHPPPAFALPSASNGKSYSASSIPKALRSAKNICFDGVPCAHKKKTDTENAEYGSTMQTIEALDPLENNVMNTGAVFGRIIKPELNYKRTDHKWRTTKDRIFDSRPIFPDMSIEREKKHFPSLSNTESTQKYQPRGRRYIPHGYGDDYEFTPHPQHIDPEYSECGPDWKSRLRWIPSPHNTDYPAEENWPEPWKPMRTYPWMSRRTGQEWVLYPEGNDATLRSTWDGVHKATEVTDKEITHSMLFGKGKMVLPLAFVPWGWYKKPKTKGVCGKLVIDKRNGIPMAAPGDKNYQAVEYSTNFYKNGSTLPVVNFGGNLTFQPDTFVPLTELPPVPRENFIAKERKRKQREEVDSVKSLDKWRPATPLQAPNHGGIGQMSIPERTELSSLSKY